MVCEFPVVVKAKLMLTAIHCLLYFSFTWRGFSLVWRYVLKGGEGWVLWRQDIIKRTSVRNAGRGLQWHVTGVTLSDTVSCYDPLQYVLMFPFGTLGSTYTRCDSWRPCRVLYRHTSKCCRWLHAFCGRTDGRTHVRTYVRTDKRTDGHLRPALLGRLCRRFDLKTETNTTKANMHP